MWSLVRVFEVMTCMGEEMTNEFDCPLLEKMDTYFAIPTNKIFRSVSIFHECTDKCTYIHGTRALTLEREEVEHQTLTFHHDNTNNYYSLNIFCIQS